MDPPATPPRAPEPAGVRWYKNPLVAATRRSAAVSFAIGLSMLLLASESMFSGEVTLFTLILVFLMFYFTDNAMGRLLMAQRAPREVGVWAGGLIVRTARSQDAYRWQDVQEISLGQVGGRYTALSVRSVEGVAKAYPLLPSHLASEIKVVWLEMVAKGLGPRERRPQPAARPVPAPVPGGFDGPPVSIGVSRSPSYWRAGPQPPGQEVAPPPPAVQGAVPLAPASFPQAPPPPPPPPPPAAPRPEWSFTRIGAGEPTPDPRYPVHGSVRSFEWHFIPGAGNATGAWMLMAVVVLSSIVVSRLTADLALSLLALESDPWVATGIGFGVGVSIAMVFYRIARAQMTGEVAGSVIFLPMFDRTKADIADALREAGLSLDAGAPRMRESRGRLTLTWPEAHTRAIVMNASQESRAIVLRTVGRGRFDLHQRFKGAILERLRAGRAQPPARPRV